jgi:hypothetical protein
MALDHKTRITSPVAMAIIWNYIDRISRGKDGENTSSPHDVEDRVILNTASLISISTNKSKSSPAGTFEIRLAPTFNWITRITVGSWIALLMSPEQDILPTSNVMPNTMDSRTFKFLGRIESVRVAVGVDPTTGARQTQYVVTGTDWGNVFMQKFYIDKVLTNNNLQLQGETSFAAHLIYANYVKGYKDKGDLPTSTQNLRLLINMWGDPLSQVRKEYTAKTGLLAAPTMQFQMPFKVATWMKLLGDQKDPSFLISSLINMYYGSLDGYDKYKGDPEEGKGFISPNSLTGMHTLWQILSANCNPMVTDLYSDIRIEGEGITATSNLALYNRIKPFVTSKNFSGSFKKSMISHFKNVRRIKVPLEEVISINAGTNFRDKVNFLEIRAKPQKNQIMFDVATKKDAQTRDEGAIARDGFRPLIEDVDYVPYDGPEAAPLEVVKWKELLREWYFSAHNMLNGSMRIIGRNEYIAVGDNIMVPSGVFGAAPFNRQQSDKEKAGDATYMLAHIEGVSHSFTVDDNGARSFNTTIQFSRGIIVDENGETLASDGDAIDKDATALINAAEKDIHDTFGRSTDSDPDIQKLKGT